MLLFRRESYKNIVDVRENKVKILKDMMNIPLKRLSGIPQTESHSNVLKQPERRYDGGFRDVGLCHGDLVIRLE